MGSSGDCAEIDILERPLLGGSSAAAGEERVLYSAAFEEEEAFVKYETAQWVVYSLLLLLAWGVGLLMLLYVPVRRYVARRDFRSRRLYVTPDAIVYKVTRPVAIPWLGVLKKEKYILLPSVADIAVEQGYLQSMFGIYSVRIENVGVKRPSNDDVHIQGISNPRAFKKAVLTRLYSIKGRGLSQAISTLGDMSPFPRNMGTESLQPGDVILQKLEEVEGSVKRIQNLLEKIPPQSSYSLEE